MKNKPMYLPIRIKSVFFNETILVGMFLGTHNSVGRYIFYWAYSTKLISAKILSEQRE